MKISTVVLSTISALAFFASQACSQPVEVTCDPLSDNAATIQNAINTGIATGEEVHLPGDLCPISSTIVARQAWNLRIVGQGMPGQGHNGGTRIVWNGPSTGTAILFDSSRDSSMERVQITPGSSHPAVGLQVDQVTPPSGGYLSTHNIFRDISIDGAGTGVQIGNTSRQNNDLHSFTNIYINGFTTYGYHINDGQSKAILISGGQVTSTASGAVGIHTTRGSFRAWGVNFGQSGGGIDVYLSDVTDNIVVNAAVSEGACQFLATGGPSGANFPVEISNSRVAPGANCGSTPYIAFFFKGTLTLQSNVINNNNFTSGSVEMYGSSPGATLISMGNRYSMANPFLVRSGYERLITIGDMFCSPSACTPIQTSIQ